MDMLPATLGDGPGKGDWIPIDHFADVLVGLALAPKLDHNYARGTTVKHVVHSRPVM